MFTKESVGQTSLYWTRPRDILAGDFSQNAFLYAYFQVEGNINSEIPYKSTNQNPKSIQVVLYAGILWKTSISLYFIMCFACQILQVNTKSENARRLPKIIMRSAANMTLQW